MQKFTSTVTIKELLLNYHTDMSISGSQKSVEIKKEGFDDFQTILKKKGRAHGGAIIGGIFLLIPFIWVVQYDIEHKYELTPSDK